MSKNDFVKSNKKDWVWMPHPGHFICARDCKFHLNTFVPSGYIISTVGEYLPDSQVREIMAESRGITLEGKGDYRMADYMKKIGYEEIGFGRKYETMVFKAMSAKAKDDDPDGLCCPWRQESGSNIDFAGYNTATEAYRGHLELCEKWARNDGANQKAKGETLK